MLALPIKDKQMGYFFILPAALMLLAVIVYPAMYSLKLSFTSESGALYFLTNYAELFRDSLFWQAFRNTLVFVGVVATFHLIIGLAIAMVLNTRIKARLLFRLVVLLPWTVPDVVAGITWKWIYDPVYGALNDLLSRLNFIHAPILWLSDPGLALSSIIFADIWRGFPFVMLILLAGLQAIPRELYEASQIDGASGFQSFRYITLPGLKKMVVVALALDIIWEFRRFGLVQAMTQGGPGHQTEVFSTLIYKEYFQFFRFEYASAIAVIMSIILLALSLPYIWMISKEQ
jgi:multiple sugar transport system permease protein